MDENIDFDADEFDEQFQEYFEMNEDELIDPKRVAKTSGSGIALETWFENDGSVQVVLFTDSSEKEKELDLAKMIDHTLLKPDATSEDIEKLCEEAGEYGFATVCVNPSNVSYCVDLLNETEVGVCTVIGFPLGANETSIKVEEAKIALENGATEIDMVMNIGALKSGAFDYVADDIHRVVLMGLIHGATVKVIIETALLTREEKIKACLIAKAMGAHFVKTSTGFSKGGATEEDIRLMRETVGPEMGVKASGGIRSREDALKMINAGATRIGASSGVAIVGGKKGNNEGY